MRKIRLYTSERMTLVSYGVLSALFITLGLIDILADHREVLGAMYLATGAVWVWTIKVVRRAWMEQHETWARLENWHRIYDA